MHTSLYLDYNATTKTLPQVRDAVIDAMDRCWANSSSAHVHGREAGVALDTARQQVAAMVRRDPRDVTFTSGATESNAWVLNGLRTAGRPEVVVSAIEHPSVKVWGTRVVGVDGNGVVRLDELERALDELGDRVAVVSIMAANNETGVLQPVDAVAALCRDRGIPSHCDATQVPGKLPVHFDADMVTLTAHKFGGPKGVGALIGRLEPTPLLQGGAHERGRRAGTSNVPGIVGMGVAASLAGTMDPGPRDALAAACKDLGALIVGEAAPRLPNTVLAVFKFPGDLIVPALDLDGVQASTGSACHSGASRAGEVLQAMGIMDLPVRLSMGPGTDPMPAVPILKRILDRLEEACAS